MKYPELLEIIKKINQDYDKIPEKEKNGIESLLKLMNKVHDFNSDMFAMQNFIDILSIMTKAVTGKDHPLKSTKLEIILQYQIMFQSGYLAGIKATSKNMITEVSLN